MNPYRPAENLPNSDNQVTKGQITQTILIAEDNEILRYTLEWILAQYSYRILVAANGVEAMAAARNHNAPIHLLCTDVNMPAMDGLELAGRFTREWPQAKVLFMTGNHLKQTWVLQKPFTEEELIAKVQEVLKSPPLRKAAQSGA